MRRSRIISSAIVALLLPQCCAFALPSDQQQPIEIEAQEMVMNQQNGVSTYSGGVILAQGSIQIEAEKLIVYMRNRKLEWMEAFGSDAAQASFRQKLTNGEETRARAGRMEYRSKNSRLILREQAQLQQGGNHIHSERIDYNTASNSLIAGQTQQQDTQQRQRVRIVIEPDDENQKTTEQKQP